MADNPYIGKIKNGGAKDIKINVQSDAKKGIVKTGTDLRSGKK